MEKSAAEADTDESSASAAPCCAVPCQVDGVGLGSSYLQTDPAIPHFEAWTPQVRCACCAVVQYSTVQYSTVQYSTVYYSSVQCSIQYCTAQRSAVQCSTVQYSTVQYHVGDPAAAQHCTARRGAALHSTAHPLLSSSLAWEVQTGCGYGGVELAVDPTADRCCLRSCRSYRGGGRTMTLCSCIGRADADERAPLEG